MFLNIQTQFNSGFPTNNIITAIAINNKIKKRIGLS
jgi:hypothetical protein